VCVIDITGVAAMDATVAITWCKPWKLAVAGRHRDRDRPVSGDCQTIVTIGVDLGKMNTVGDLQGASNKPSACWATRSFRRDTGPVIGRRWKSNPQNRAVPHSTIQAALSDATFCSCAGR